MNTEDLYNFEIPFEIRILEGSENLTYKGSLSIAEIKPNTINLEIDNKNMKIEINKNGGTIYIDCDSEENIYNISEKVKKIISFLLEKGNRNKQDGNIYVDINYFNHNKTPCNFSKNNITNDSQGITIFDSISIYDKIGIKTEKRITLESFYKIKSDDKLCFFLENYINALKSSVEKQKFVSLFLILEYLESSEDYKKFIERKQNEGEIRFLFLSEDIEQIIKCSAHLNDRQKNKIKELKENLRYTNWNRAKKLYEYLKEFLKNVESILSEQELKKIINLRNKVLHASLIKEEEEEKILKILLYNKLFPLSENIIESLLDARDG